MTRSISLTSLELNPSQRQSQTSKDHKNPSTKSDIHFNNTNPSFPSSSLEVLLNNDKKHKSLTSTLILAVFAAICGTSFHFGYASGVINSPQDAIQRFINETSYRRNPNSRMSESMITLIFSFAVSIFAVGGMIGGLAGGFITERFGRKGGMLINNLVSAVACILMFLTKPIRSYEVLIIGRFLIGLSCGYGSSVAPTYINEISPKHLRGTLGVTFQLGVVLFICLSQVFTLRPILGLDDKWHYALGLPIVFSVLQFVLLLIVPESPKYLLLKRSDTSKAKKVLQWLRQDSNIQNELSEIEEEEHRQEHSARIIDLFRTPIIRWALFLTIILQLSQQLSGINAVFYYSNVIFRAANFDQQTAEYANIGLGCALILITIVSIFLMDRLGRRPLHLIGLGGMFVTSLILFISFVVPSTNFWNKISLIMTIVFVTFFGIGPGSIPWLITAELFTQTYRVPASSLAVLVNWSANFAVGLAFKPLFTSVLDKYTFLIFIGLLFIFFLFTLFFVPETKAKTVDKIYDEINAGHVWRKSRSKQTTNN